MHSTLIVLNDVLLLACCSMYLGTGWSLILFSFSNAANLTIDNYYEQFVPQVTAATRFFTVMTIVMLGAAGVMIVSEWHHRVWAPVIVLVGVIAATVLTEVVILPVNKVMAGHIRDPALLRATLSRWMTFNRFRVALWTLSWLAMAIYFGLALGER
ncbi:MAG: hypothetical protein QOF83_4176 [Solirubrobacteraceae bacterium]|jgi:hypothetical protein|nr:hypothetical protein [Solirubrobacteraceae bacterium]